MTALNHSFSKVRGRSPLPRGRQRGLTLFSLLFWGILVGFVGYLLVRALPTLNEYFTIQRTVDKIAKEQPATVAVARQAVRLRERDQVGHGVIPSGMNRESDGPAREGCAPRPHR